MTIQHRETGWLSPLVHCKFREILTHTMFRYGLCCPVYYCTPDHINLLWIGILDSSDQRNAAKYFRKQLNVALDETCFRLQRQPYDHVLREEERQRPALQKVAEYIAKNPKRAAVVEEEAFLEYPYTDCLVPGYPELTLWQDDFWNRFWRIYSYMQENGLTRV